MATGILPHVTPRQKQVLDLLVRGYTNSQIAEALGVSLDGAKWHVREIIAELGVDGREEAAEYWREYNGLPRRLKRLVLSPLSWLPSPARVALGLAAAAPIAVIAVVLASQMAGEGDVQAPDSSPPPSTPLATASPEATAAAGGGSPTAAVVDDESPRALRTEPAAGDCETVFALQGERFDVGKVIEFHRWTGLDDTVLLGTATGGHDGTVTLAGLTAPDDCFPGAQYVYEARVAASGVAVESRAIFGINHIGTFEVALAPGSCPPAITVTGTGLPPGLDLFISAGDANPFAHNFVGIGQATVRADGTFSLDTTVPADCGRETIGIYAGDSSGVLRARWRAALEIVP